MRGARRLVLVLRVRKISSMEHQMGTLRGEIPAAEWGTRSEKNPTSEGFNSRRIAERAFVGMSALTLPSGEISSAECIDTVLRIGKISSAEIA